MSPAKPSASKSSKDYRKITPRGFGFGRRTAKAFRAGLRSPFGPRSSLPPRTRRSPRPRSRLIRSPTSGRASPGSITPRTRRFTSSLSGKAIWSRAPISIPSTAPQSLISQQHLEAKLRKSAGRRLPPLCAPSAERGGRASGPASTRQRAERWHSRCSLPRLKLPASLPIRLPTPRGSSRRPSTPTSRPRLFGSASNHRCWL